MMNSETCSVLLKRCKRADEDQPSCSSGATQQAKRLCIRLEQQEPEATVNPERQQSTQEKVDRWLQDFLSQVADRFRISQEGYLLKDSPYKSTVYFMQKEDTYEYYIGTTIRLTKPCRIWKSREVLSLNIAIR